MPRFVLLFAIALCLSCCSGSTTPDIVHRLDASGPTPDAVGDLSQSEPDMVVPTDLLPDSGVDARHDALAWPSLRVPGEWESQAATWMQWPTNWEASLRPNFAAIIAVLQTYQPLHLLVLDSTMEANARELILAAGGDPEMVTYHLVPYDNSWLRDNGPVYVVHDQEVALQDWGFDAWGGNFGGDIPGQQDDAVPAAMGQWLELPYDDYNDYVLERGNLESNGQGTLVLNWDCQLDRNPTMSKEQTETLFAQRLGASRVIWAHGHDPADGTTGHIDGTVRFVDETTVAVARSLIPDDPNAKDMDDVAMTLAHAGFDVVRIDVPGTVDYKGEALPAMYMNWLVGNGFVAAMAFGNADWDNAAKAQLEVLFPGRTVHMIETLELWYNGGGIHCVTNDQPL